MTVLTRRFVEAVACAVELHAAQRRKAGGGPYAAHLLRVAGIALDHGADEDEAIAALLHDAVEDQGGPATREEIRRRFGARVAEIVEGCSDTDESPKPPWRERKQRHLARLATAPASVRLVAAADKLDNARSLLSAYLASGEQLWTHFGGGREGTLWYCRAALEALKRPGITPLVAELERAVRQVEETAGPGPPT